jgi:hypothetical protein
MSTPPLSGTTWRHFKGSEYVVIATAKHSESLELMVVYRKKDSLGGDDTWIRPLSMWEEIVNVEDKETKRFTQME